MTYRFQDILRMVIPGLYLLALCFILFAWIGWIDLSKESNIHSLLVSSFANALALLLPFIGFVFGYIINVVSSYFERILYKSNCMTRPSAHVLNGDSDYHINEDKLENLKKKEGIDSADNDNSNVLFQKAKETLRSDENINVFYAQSVLARNLAGCQIIFTIICLGCIFENCKLSLCWTVGSLLLGIIMVYNWRRQRCVYAKYVFAAYLDSLNN